MCLVNKSNDMENNKNMRRVWTYEETRCLLSFYGLRKEEFNHPRKKRQAFTNLVEDMTSSGVLKSPVSPTMLENKMKSVLRAYKTMKDAGNRSGAASYIGPYADLLEDIFEKKICKKSDISHIVSTGVSSGQSLDSRSLQQRSKSVHSHKLH